MSFHRPFLFVIVLFFHSAKEKEKGERGIALKFCASILFKYELSLLIKKKETKRVSGRRDQEKTPYTYASRDHSTKRSCAKGLWRGIFHHGCES